MKNFFKIIFFNCLIINILSVSIGSENFFEQGIKFYNEKKYEDARFMFERNIVFNPKDSS